MHDMRGLTHMTSGPARQLVMLVAHSVVLAAEGRTQNPMEEEEEEKKKRS